MKILYLIILFFQEATSLNNHREYIACAYNHKEPNSTFHRHFSFCRYTLSFFLCRLSIYTYRVDLYIYRHFLVHCSHIQAFLHLLLTQKGLLRNKKTTPSKDVLIKGDNNELKNEKTLILKKVTS